MSGATKKIGSFTDTVSKIANSPVARTISTAIGSAGRALTPLLASNPETAPFAGIADKVAKGLQTGQYLNKVSNVADRISGVLT